MGSKFDQQQQQQLPNNSRIRGVWGDPDVHDLTPKRTSHVRRSFPTDPQKTFLKRKKKKGEKKGKRKEEKEREKKGKGKGKKKTILITPFAKSNNEMRK